MSLAIALGASVTAFLAWRTFRPEPPATPFVRTLKDALLPYVCERGHRFNAVGQVGSVACPHCQMPSYPRTAYRCPVHGDQEVEVEFQRAADGSEAVARIRLPNGEWTPPGRVLRCPSCQSPMARMHSEDPARLGQ